MKNIIKGIMMVMGAAVVFAACRKFDSLPGYANGTAPVLSADISAVTSAPADSSKAVLHLSWTNPHYATDSATQKYVIEIDSSGRNFTHAHSTTISGALNASFTAAQLNSIVAAFAFKPDSTNALDIRLKSSYENNNELYTSNVVTVTIKPYIVPVVLTPSSVTPLTLSIGNAANTALSFKWTASEYGSSKIYYAVQIDTAGDNFAHPQVIKNDTVLSSAITVSNLNTAVLSTGAAVGVATGIQFRIAGYLDAGYTQPSVYSNTVAISVTPYLPFLYLYAPGDYQGWNPPTAPPIAATVPNLNAYEGYVNVPSGGTYQFKITNAPDWNHTAYGDGGNGTLSASGGNLMWPSDAGYYYLKADLSALTWSATPVNWGVIGDATPNGWNASTELTFDAVNNVWVINSVALTAGAIKFRANDAWDINLGGNVNGLTYNGDNISITNPGNYKIALDLSHPLKYTVTLTKL